LSGLPAHAALVLYLEVDSTMRDSIFSAAYPINEAVGTFAFFLWFKYTYIIVEKIDTAISTCSPAGRHAPVSRAPTVLE
jgi:hypothetical protein